MSKEDFDKFLIESVDEGLSSIGESSKQAIYFYLEKHFNVKKHEIPCKIEDFECAIERIFGLGADFLETLIIKNLYEKAGGSAHVHEPGDLAFAECVATAERSFVANNKPEEVV